MYEMWREKFMINCAKKKCIKGFRIKDEDLPKIPEKGTTKDKKKEFEILQIESSLESNKKKQK